MRLRSPAGLLCLALIAACDGPGAKEAATYRTHAPAPVRVPVRPPRDEPFRSQPPPLERVAPLELAAPRETKLSNGVRAVLLSRPAFPTVTTELVLTRGAADAGPGVAATYARAMLGSSRDYDTSEAWVYLQFVGASIGVSVTPASVSLGVTALSPLFVSALSRAGSFFAAPSLDGDDLDDARSWNRIRRTDDSQDPVRMARERLSIELFPEGHPWARPVRPEGKWDDTPTNAAVRAFRDELLSADEVIAVCVGGVDDGVMLRALEKHLGSLPRKRAPARVAHDLPFPMQKRPIVIVDRPGASQSIVAAGWLVPKAASTDAAALEVLAAAAGNSLGSRLNATIRRELGATYGVRAKFEQQRDFSSFTIDAAIATERTADAIARLLQELELLRTRPLEASELEVAVLKAGILPSNGTNASLAALFANALARGLTIADVVGHDTRLASIGSGSVRDAAGAHLPKDGMRVVIVGDAAKIAEPLRAIGDVVVQR